MELNVLFKYFDRDSEGMRMINLQAIFDYFQMEFEGFSRILERVVLWGKHSWMIMNECVIFRWLSMIYNWIRPTVRWIIWWFSTGTLRRRRSWVASAALPNQHPSAPSPRTCGFNSTRMHWPEARRDSPSLSNPSLPVFKHQLWLLTRVI